MIYQSKTCIVFLKIKDDSSSFLLRTNKSFFFRHVIFSVVAAQLIRLFNFTLILVSFEKMVREKRWKNSGS